MPECAFPMFHDKLLCGCPADAKGRPQRPSKPRKAQPAASPLRSRRIQRAAPLRRSATPLRRTRVRVKARDLGAEETWEQLRTGCKDRARGWCEARWDPNCRGRGHHAHHVKPRSRGGADELTNLAWVCSTCHQQIHDHPAEAKRRGLLS